MGQAPEHAMLPAEASHPIIVGGGGAYFTLHLSSPGTLVHEGDTHISRSSLGDGTPSIAEPPFMPRGEGQPTLSDSRS